MAQITVDEETENRHDLLRSVLPAGLALLLLLGVVVAGGMVLRDLLDFGVWFVSSY
jgi:hypothetical protein